MIGATLPLLAFAYAQSIAFALNSRSRNRSSPTFHFIANVLAVIVFFWMLDWIVKSELSLEMIPTYVVGTVLGSLTGAQIAGWIEPKIGAFANIPKGSVVDEFFNFKVEGEFSKRRFVARMWPIGAPLLVLSAYLLMQSSALALAFAALASYLFFESFTHTHASRAGNRDKPMVTLFANLFMGVVGFLIYRRIVEYQMGWALFIPYVAGNVVGSISGMLTASHLEKKTGASADAHVTAPRAPKRPLWLIVVPFAFAVIVLVESWALWGIAVALLRIYGFALAQNFSFLFVSRARNRSNVLDRAEHRRRDRASVVLYHAVASVFSNGIWFLTFRDLYRADLDWPFVIPYMLGVTSGSLLAFYFAISIERKIGAVADLPAGRQARLNPRL